jgi:hypothetical protein
MLLPLALLAALSGAEPSCTIVRTAEIYIREPTETWIVGTVLPGRIVSDTIVLRDGSQRVHRGVPVQIESVSGNGSDRELFPGDTVAIFMWTIGGPACERASYGLESASRHHFELVLRSNAGWVDARPTLDLELGIGLNVYPGRASSLPPITFDEYLTFVSTIPTRADWTTDCRPAVQRMNAWISAHVYGGSPGTRPFGDIAVALVGSCEQDIQQKAYALVVQGTTPSEGLARFLTEHLACSIGIDLYTAQPYALRGRFTPNARADQWAVLCADDESWRLLVVNSDENQVLAELTRSVGNPTQREFRVAPREYFHWAQIYDPTRRDQLLAAPSNDAILLDNFAYWWQDGQWTAAWSDCCYFTY